MTSIFNEYMVNNKTTLNQKIETLYNILKLKREALCTTPCIAHWANLFKLESFCLFRKSASFIFFTFENKN